MIYRILDVMMHNHNALLQFVRDFQIMRDDGVVVFPGRVQYHVGTHSKTRYSEVQILLGNGLDTIYLTNPDLAFEDLPDTFVSNTSTYHYTEKNHLTIGTKNEPGVFVKIYPILPQ
jgi:hypothetical protein